jgi:hypothetical protein
MSQEIIFHESNGSGGETKKIKIKKFIKRAAIVVLAIVLTAGGLYFFWQKGNQKKESVENLKNINGDFNQSIALINGISTEKRMKYDDDSDLYLKKTEDELRRTEKALEKIKVFNQKIESSAENNLNKNLKIILEDYYSNALKNLEEYLRYMKYLVDGSDLSVFFSDNMMNLKRKYERGEIKSDLELYEAMAVYLNNGLDKEKKLDPPEKLIAYEKSGVDYFLRFKDIVDKIVVALKNKDRRQVSLMEKELNDLISSYDEKEDEKIEDEYFSSLHQNFSDLRNEAGEVRKKMIESGVNLEINLENQVIDAW